MIRLVSIDPELIIHPDEILRNQSWDWIAQSCGWSNRNLLAEIPQLKRLAVHLPEGTSRVRFNLFLAHLKEKKQTIRLPIPEGESWEEKAESSEWLDYILAQRVKPSPADPRIKEFEHFINNLPDLTERFTLSDVKFLKYLDLLVLSSLCIDVIDPYLPLESMNPVFKHWIHVFGKSGPLRFAHELRPRLVLHISERSNDRASKINVRPEESAQDLLERMKSYALVDSFKISFFVWQPSALHDRFIVADIGGISLGRSLNAQKSTKITASALGNHLAIRREYERTGPHRAEFIRELSME